MVYFYMNDIKVEVYFQNKSFHIFVCRFKTVKSIKVKISDAVGQFAIAT